MKVKVLVTFEDKNNTSISYKPGTSIDIDDESRIKDCAERGLIMVLEEPTKVKKAEDSEEKTVKKTRKSKGE